MPIGIRQVERFLVRRRDQREQRARAKAARHLRRPKRLHCRAQRSVYRGYITRHYGQPQKGIHAIQLELSQRTYIHEDAPYAFDETGATFVRPFLRKLLEAMLEYLGYPAGPAIV